MQITLPENTTHIVICTSNRNNNNQTSNSSHNSVTLDINPNGGEAECCNRSNISHIPTTAPSPGYFGAEVIKSVVDSVEKKMVKTNEACNVKTAPPILSGISNNGGGKRAHYNCAECGKTYSTSSNLARHRQTHR